MNSKIVKSKNDDIIYYNGSLTNSQGQFISQSAVPCVFYDQRTQQILEKSDEYLMSVVRWSLPTSTIPLLILTPLDFIPIPPYAIPNFNRDLIGYSVILSWWTGTDYVDFTTYIEYTPQNAIPPTTILLPQTQQNEMYWYIYTYQHLLNMINSALLDCFTRLKAHYGAAPGTTAPKMIYDPVTNLYTLLADDAFQAPALNPVDPTNSDPNIRFGSQTAITVWLNLYLWDTNFIPAWNFDYAGLNNFSKPDPDTFYVSNKAVRIVIENNTGLANTGTTRLVSELPVISNTSAFQNITLTSSTLPVNYESINPALQNTSATNNTLQIISDYTYDVFSSTDTISARLGIVYTPSVYRFTVLNSKEPLTRIQITAQFLDNVNVPHTIGLRSNSTFSFKLMFVKKSKLQRLISEGMKAEIY